MRLVVGLGNPGSRYARNRHNVGFMAVDLIARRLGVAGFRSRFKGELAEGVIGGERQLLLKPQTYMNDSGESVAEAARFFKISPEEIVVIHDEIDLRPGKLRVKRGGGTAGHNGLRSIDALLGSDFEVVALWVAPLLEAVAETIGLLLSGAPDAFMSEVARRFAPPDLDAADGSGQS